MSFRSTKGGEKSLIISFIIFQKKLGSNVRNFIQLLNKDLLIPTIRNPHSAILN
jgi:hypothetical protein